MSLFVCCFCNSKASLECSCSDLKYCYPHIRHHFARLYHGGESFDTHQISHLPLDVLEEEEELKIDKSKVTRHGLAYLEKISQMSLKEKKDYLAKLGVGWSSKDIQKYPVHEVRMSNDEKYLFVCMLYADSRT